VPLHFLFCKIVVQFFYILRSQHLQEKVLERVFKYWKWLLEVEESSLLGNALTYQREERENNWICGIRRELDELCMGYMWIIGRENDRSP
jgi:hypothetical protein